MANKIGKYASGGSMLPHTMDSRPKAMSAGNTKTGQWSSKDHPSKPRMPQGQRPERGQKKMGV